MRKKKKYLVKLKSKGEMEITAVIVNDVDSVTLDDEMLVFRCDGEIKAAFTEFDYFNEFNNSAGSYES